MSKELSELQPEGLRVGKMARRVCLLVLAMSQGYGGGDGRQKQIGKCEVKLASLFPLCLLSIHTDSNFMIHLLNDLFR